MLTPEDRQQYDQLMASGILGRLPQHLLWKLMKEVQEQRKRRYPRNHAKKKYGSMNKGFTADEFTWFIKHVDNPKAKLAYQLQYALGLRAGEVVVINVREIDWASRTIVINSLKTATKDVLPLHDAIYEPLLSWVNAHQKEILAHDGYVLFSDNPTIERPHISKDWLRNYFGKARAAAGLTQVYAMTREKDRPSHRQFRLTTHSCRHSFGTTLWKATRDPKIVQRALRHQDSKSTDVYIHVPQEEVDSLIRTTFGKNTLVLEVTR